MMVGILPFGRVISYHWLEIQLEINPPRLEIHPRGPGSGAAEVVVAAVAVEEAMVEEVTVVLVQVASRERAVV